MLEHRRVRGTCGLDRTHVDNPGNGDLKETNGLGLIDQVWSPKNLGHSLESAWARKGVDAETIINDGQMPTLTRLAYSP
jgi:hypothetical protein